MDERTYFESETEPRRRTQSAEHERDGIFVGRHLAEHKQEIIDRWEMLVREKVPESGGQSSLVIANTLPEFLDELAGILEERRPVRNMVPVQGMSKIHGEKRAGLFGYFLPQLVNEYSLLRQVLEEELQELEPVNSEVRMTVNKVIDSAISLAVTEFSRVQGENTKTALRESEASNRDLERFAAIAAHDLKSPLATITGYLELLTDEVADEPGNEGRLFIKLMSDASQRMRNLVDRLLDYARLNSVKKPFQPTDINSVVDAALENLADDIGRTGSALTRDALPTVMGDFDLLVQLVQNLISNSIKFRSDRALRIHIGLRSQGDMWLFSVTDNGIGFDPAQKEDVFSLYKKLHGESEYQGAGIGLATCRKVVELHGGKIWADSKPGEGSTFSFTLPKILPKIPPKIQGA